MKLLPPSKATLRKYGLTSKTWYDLLDAQSGRCPICWRTFTSDLRPVTDHEHVRNWKKLSDKDRASKVRGLLCGYCNLRRIPKKSKDLADVDIANNIYHYLLDYSMRK